eukprot:COSAG01_NODE_60292_length_295_cov_1.438776_1_plen_47_part_10
MGSIANPPAWTIIIQQATDTDGALGNALPAAGRLNLCGCLPAAPSQR